MSTELFFRKDRYRISESIRANDGRVYSIQEQLGAGGNGVVHECVDEADGSPYAIKFHTHTEENRILRFAREKQLMTSVASAKHDHLIHFKTSGVVSATRITRKKHIAVDLPFFIMEKATCSLKQYVKDQLSPIPSEVYIAQFRGLASALQCLHLHALHRDIKPDNILVIGERWVISDFGLCKMNEDFGDVELTHIWEILGPRFWMSPEANNRSVGVDEQIVFSSDIFQLASVFWWVVNKKHPSGILTRDDWSGLESLFEPMSTALQHSPLRRFSTAEEFSRAVISAIAG